MKNAKSNKISSPSKADRPDLRDLSSRLLSAIERLGIEKREFAEAGGVTAQTLSGYLAAAREPGYSVLCGWIRSFHLDGNWLLTGEGEMLSGVIKHKTQSLPAEEISDKLTPEQRNMLTYKRLQTELGMDKQRIAEGIEAIVMGKRGDERKSDREPGFDEGVGFSERGEDESGGGEPTGSTLQNNSSLG